MKSAMLICLVGAGIALVSAQPPDTRSAPAGRIRKPQMSDTIRANIYADNSFELYLNGQLVAVDSIRFIPHNVISVDILPEYPVTIAVRAHDNADPKTGMEYANTSIGDGGFILKFADGTVTNSSWKAMCVSSGPVGGDTKNPRTESVPEPPNWMSPEFDDSSWGPATEYTEEQIDPKAPFFEHDFNNARFIWTDDLKLDNTILFRHVVKSPPDEKDRPDFSRLNEVVPEGGPRPPRRGGRPRR
ncbi:MAG: hypothetical protein ACK526_08610 [Planctomyces sp.]